MDIYKNQKVTNLVADKKVKTKQNYYTFRSDMGFFSHEIPVEARLEIINNTTELKMQIRGEVEHLLTKEEREEIITTITNCMAVLGVDEVSLKFYKKDINYEALYCVKTSLNVELEIEEDECGEPLNVFN